MSTELSSYLMAMVPWAQNGNLVSETHNALTNPLVQLALIAVPCILCLVARRYKLVVAFLSIPASCWMLQYGTADISAPEFYATRLVVFVAGFLVIAAVNLYYYVVRD